MPGEDPLTKTASPHEASALGWRPLEIYLYDWWPLRDERRVLQRLSRMKVRLDVPTTPPPSPPSGRQRIDAKREGSVYHVTHDFS